MGKPGGALYNAAGHIDRPKRETPVTKRALIALIAPTVALLAMPAAVSAAEAGLLFNTLLTVNAEGRVAKAPDIAEVSGGVVTVAPTAAAALAANSRKMTEVVAAVRRAGIAEKDIQTAGLNLQAQYRYPQNQAPVLTGYQVSNTVSLRIRDIASAGKLLDTLVGVGANQINGPNFSIDKADEALDAARQEAVAKARARAELYARAAGLRVKRIVMISEGGGFQPPMPMPKFYARAAMADAAPAPPIAAGEVALSVTVSMTFELE